MLIGKTLRKSLGRRGISRRNVVTDSAMHCECRQNVDVPTGKPPALRSFQGGAASDFRHRLCFRKFTVLYPRSVFYFLSLFLLTSKAAQAARAFSAWEEFDSPHAMCERPISLHTGREAFFEVANKVEGRDAYNQLVRFYSSKKWRELATGIEAFRAEYPASPLREAVAFLEVQSLLDRSDGRSDDTEKAAEKKLRNVLLQYPNSDLAPILAAAAGAHWLKTGNYQRSLAVYETAAQAHPTHELRCTFLLGVGETSFLLRHFDAAEKNFDQVLNQCRNFRLRTAAKIRKIDKSLPDNAEGMERQYETLIAEDSPFIERFYQPTLANLGEIKYQLKKYDEAAYYYDRYLKTEKGSPDCVAASLKRMADIDHRRGKSASEVTGRYLAVYEKSANTNEGIFSQLHALMTDPALKRGAELERRIRLFDDKVDKITDESLRTRLYVEKGLTLLEMAQPGALSFLAKLKDKVKIRFDQGKSGAFIRSRIVSLAKKGELAPLGSSALLDTLEEVHAVWLKDQPEESWARSFYADQLVARFVALDREGKLSDAMAMLHRWREAALWPNTGPSAGNKEAIARALLTDLIKGGSDSAAALLVSQSQATLQPFLEPEFRIVGWLAGLQIKASASRGGWLKWERELATTSSRLSPDMVPVFRLASAVGLRLQGDFAGAEAALKGLKSVQWRERIVQESVAVAVGRGQGEKAFRILRSEWATADTKNKPALLQQMRAALEETKSWSKAPELLSLAKKSLSEGEELGGYFQFAGKVLAENRECKQAIPLLQTALKMAGPSTAPESHFRAGRCFAVEKRLDDAREQWTAAINLKDPFWSPLAQSEMKLVFP